MSISHRFEAILFNQLLNYISKKSETETSVVPIATDDCHSGKVFFFSDLIQKQK